jgi:hypothetical protein
LFSFAFIKISNTPQRKKQILGERLCLILHLILFMRPYI